MATCCICLDEYSAGDAILTLPCKHYFHKACITPWLTQRQRLCPLCKRDPVATERTPLLPTLRNSAADTSETAGSDVVVDGNEAARPLLDTAVNDGF